MKRSPGPLLALLLAATSCGKTHLSDREACDGGATVQQICGWNNATQDYDRGCVYYCSDFTCPTGATVRRQCAWSPETQTFDRDCKIVCASDAGG
jgi:hypothetical protein